ncbi:MAG: hypothetical protein ABI583_07095, partial [Betaproteobacteria bacterium]
MSTINNTYINALLADAAYAERLFEGMTSGQLLNALSPTMTPTLATFISDNFELVAHKESGDYVESGFDATVWKGRAGTTYAGQVYVSMQGTLGAQDFLQDINLETPGGAAGKQLADMVNWWNQITTSGDAEQIKPIEIPGPLKFFTSAPSVPGTNLLAGVSSVQVNGHSLGGYLASAFARLFGDRIGGVAIEGVTTFNSAGFAPGSELAFMELERAMGIGSTTFKNDKQANVFAQYGINVATNTFYSEQIGKRVPLFNEEGAGIPNHSMYKLTDALALGMVMEKLDPTLTLEDFNSILGASANAPQKSLETTLDALRRVIYRADVAATKIGDAKDSAPSRRDFHDALDVLRASNDLVDIANAGMARIRDLTPFDASTIATTAATGAEALAYRYALRELNSFAVVGIDYSNFNQNKELELWNQATSTGALTSDWINDRAAYFQWKLKANATDVVGSIRGPYSPTNTEYSDAAAGETLLVKGQVLGFDSSAPVQRVIFGGTANDTIEGGVNNDHLYASAGTDTITGGKGDDYLEGGEGFDDYVFNNGDGKDTILDIDGRGWLSLGQRTQYSAKRGVKDIGKNTVYNDDAAGLQFEFIPATVGATRGQLILTRLNSTSTLNATDAITLQNFDLAKAKGEGYLGIKLDDRKQIALTDDLRTNIYETGAVEAAAIVKKIANGGSQTINVMTNFVAEANQKV